MRADVNRALAQAPQGLGEIHIPTQLKEKGYMKGINPTGRKEERAIK